MVWNATSVDEVTIPKSVMHARFQKRQLKLHELEREKFKLRRHGIAAITGRTGKL